MTVRRPSISGVPLLTLFHRDGRFVRAPGLFAFARRQGDGGYEILHLELAEAVNRQATPGHPRWMWALQAGMDTLLVHLLGARHALASAEFTEARWHPEAQVVIEDVLERNEEGGPRAPEPLDPGWPATLNVAGEAH